MDIILDTDIGTDVDDLWALALAIASPELTLKGITIEGSQQNTRASVALEFLARLGIHVPVHCGRRQTLSSDPEPDTLGNEGASLERRYETTGDAVEVLRRFGGHVIGVGPMTNLAIATGGWDRLTQMAGDLAGPNEPRKEHNIACDPVAAEQVLTRELPVRLVGLNVTKQTSLRPEHVSRLLAIGSPAADFLYRETQTWLSMTHRTKTPMHDPLAVASVIEPGILTWGRYSPVFPSPGLMAFQPNNSGNLEVALDVKVARFEELFIDRVFDLLTG